MRQISNLCSQDVSTDILPDLVVKGVAEFNKFYHFQKATLEILKGTFNK